jgi:hypothetical protein
MCDIWINVLLQTSALVGPSYVLHNVVAACTALSQQQKYTSAVDPILVIDIRYSSREQQFLLLRQANDSHEPSR